MCRSTHGLNLHNTRRHTHAHIIRQRLHFIIKNLYNTHTLRQYKRNAAIVLQGPGNGQNPGIFRLELLWRLSWGTARNKNLFRPTRPARFQTGHFTQTLYHALKHCTMVITVSPLSPLHTVFSLVCKDVRWLNLVLLRTTELVLYTDFFSVKSVPSRLD